MKQSNELITLLRVYKEFLIKISEGSNEGLIEQIDFVRVCIEEDIRNGLIK